MRLVSEEATRRIDPSPWRDSNFLIQMQHPHSDLPDKGSRVWCPRKPLLYYWQRSKTSTATFEQMLQTLDANTWNLHEEHSRLSSGAARYTAMHFNMLYALGNNDPLVTCLALRFVALILIVSDLRYKYEPWRRRWAKGVKVQLPVSTGFPHLSCDVQGDAMLMLTSASLSLSPYIHTHTHSVHMCTYHTHIYIMIVRDATYA